jgi:hypothetical protein
VNVAEKINPGKKKNKKHEHRTGMKARNSAL